MKKLEKDLILKDLEYANNEYDVKIDKLKSIVDLFLDEEPEVAEENALESDKEQEEKIQKIIDDEEKLNEQKENSIEEKPEEIIEEDIKMEELPTDIKTLYRKIVMMTHPDKNKNKNNNEYFSKLYGKVIKAKDNNDNAEIIYIAYKLKISEVYDISDEHFNVIKRKIKEKQQESERMNMNSFWVWYHTDNQQIKQSMAAQIAQMAKRK